MVIGADTGFFIELAKGNTKVKDIWDKISNGDEELAVSVISLNEIAVYFYRKGNVEGKDNLDDDNAYGRCCQNYQMLII